MSAPDLARAEVAKAMDATAGGVLESADETVAVSTESGYKNPLGTVNEGWGEVFMGATMESVLVGYNDPRLIKYYSKAEGGDIKDEKGNLIIAERNKIAGTYKGVPQRNRSYCKKTRTVTVCIPRVRLPNRPMLS